jgi:hypothetical protein
MRYAAIGLATAAMRLPAAICPQIPHSSPQLKNSFARIPAWIALGVSKSDNARRLIPRPDGNRPAAVPLHGYAFPLCREVGPRGGRWPISSGPIELYGPFPEIKGAAILDNSARIRPIRNETKSCIDR